MSRQERERKIIKIVLKNIFFCDCRCLHVLLFLNFNLQWFVNNAAEDEKIDVAVLKYKADLHFAKQDYSEAKILYEKFLRPMCVLILQIIVITQKPLFDV